MDTKNTIKTLSQSLLDEVKKIMKKEKGEKSERGESDADEKREHCSEALKGDQHKIDANKNGKIDSHDFKLLRKKKGVAETYTTLKTGEDLSEEEVEQIDELSKGTLASYVKKASTSAANAGMEHGIKKAERDEVDRMTNRHMSFDDKDKIHKAMKTTHRDVEKPREKAGKRIWGINKAVDKITKEEVELTQEEIDRLDAIMAGLDEGLETQTIKHPVGQRPKGIGWTLKQAGEQTGKDHSIWQRKFKRVVEEVDLDEARGRPPKEGSDAWKRQQAAGASEQDEPRQHPIQQLERIKRDMRGGGEFKHKDGTTHKLSGGQAAKLLDKYHGMKPAEKEAMQKEIHANHAGLKKHL